MDNGTLPIAQAAAGDQEAFAQLVHRMMPLIRAQIHDCGCAGVEDEDWIQEALMGLLAAVRTYRPDGGASFTTYATACIRNRLLSVARRNGPRANREQSLEDSPEPSDAATIDPSLLLLDKETVDDLLQMLQAQLTDLEYRVFRWRISGFSYAEIAAHLGITVKAVDNAIQRIRRKMVQHKQ
ncbi:MAG: sigma-70 family RNA polymerase sigma factor [Clostridia bacterium]|nr:sigma-70 family RNA polymerase sigma factor [Clostridia bacterium]